MGANTREEDLKRIESFLANTPPPADYGTPAPPAPDLTKEEIRKGELIKKRMDEESTPLDPAKLPDGEQIAQNFRSGVKDVKFRLEKLPSPGGIIFPLLILMIFFFAIVPVGGKTRLGWIWAVLTGEASLPLMGGVTISGPAAASSPPGRKVAPTKPSKTNTKSSNSNSNSNTNAGQNGKGGDSHEALNSSFAGYSHLLGSEFE